MNVLLKVSLIIIIILSSSNRDQLAAQDTHYWNLHYGTRSTLLSGAVIGSVSDMAATYYNPAALALFPAPEILLSGKVYQYNSLSLNNGAGPGKDLTSSTIEAAPTLFAGSFTLIFPLDNCRCNEGLGVISLQSECRVTLIGLNPMQRR